MNSQVVSVRDVWCGCQLGFPSSGLKHGHSRSLCYKECSRVPVQYRRIQRVVSVVSSLPCHHVLLCQNNLNFSALNLTGASVRLLVSGAAKAPGTGIPTPHVCWYTASSRLCKRKSWDGLLESRFSRHI